MDKIIAIFEPVFRIFDEWDEKFYLIYIVVGLFALLVTFILYIALIKTGLLKI